MKKFLTGLFLTLGICQATVLLSQNCESQIIEDRVIGNMHVLKTNPQTVVVRGTYTYSLDLRNDNNGIVARVYSKGGELFNQNDELIFIDDQQNRRSYRFVEMGEMSKDGGSPVHQNTLQLDLSAIEWFSTSMMSIIFIKNNVKNQMLKFTVNPNRQTDFQLMANCFYQKLDKNMVKDVQLTGSILSSSGDGGPVSKTSSSNQVLQGGGTVKRVADISQLNDQELAELYDELRKTKQRVK